MASETVEVRTAEVEKTETGIVELIVDLAWIAGFGLIGIGVVQAFSNPAVIVEYANGTLTIQGVTFRYLLAGIFLMGWRTGYQILRKILDRLSGPVTSSRGQTKPIFMR